MNEKFVQLKEKIKTDGLDALVVSKGSDVKYLTGFSGEYGVAILVVTPDKDYFITDTRFEYQASLEVPDCEVVVFGSGHGYSYFTSVGEAIHKAGLKKVGIMQEEISYFAYQSLINKAPQVDYVQSKSYLTQLRMVKTKEEIELIKKACNISERSFYALLDTIRPGITEIDIANELEYQFRKHGGSGFCFETIVASGPDNGANCHAKPSMRKLQTGDFVTIDFGTYYNGYCSDLTRTVTLGKPKEEELLKIYKIVYEAKHTAEAMLKPGVSMREVDFAVRSIIEKEGYLLPHGTGHGIGLDIHEFPFLNKESDTRLEPGIIHTIEPGIYVPGIGGVRIEDDYLITKEGADRITNITNTLIEL
jgi:Xaa-Pro aminopeptidase